MVCGDVDEDGKDEILLGSCMLDDNGTLLWSTGLVGHFRHFIHRQIVVIRQLLVAFAARGVNPVSYTHLDVYKRQAGWCAMTRRRRCVAGNTRGSRPVSYTHLLAA